MTLTLVRLMMLDHKQVRVKYRGKFIKVDEGIAPLLKAIWKLGIETTLSCQENRDGIAWIEFATAEDAKAFIDIVSHRHDSDPHSLYNRIAGEWCDDDAKEPPLFWEFSTSPHDLNKERSSTDEDEVDENAARSARFYLPGFDPVSRV